MWPVLANPLGLWALLGVPVVLAIHFFQQRSRAHPISTLFLLEPLVPESRHGRTWERLRSSRALWLQLLAIVLATWLLIQPRWIRAESVQTIAIVIDDSVAMTAFRPATEKAVTGIIAKHDGQAAHTEWLLLTTDPRKPPLYHGRDHSAALAQLAAWHPALGTHDCRPALQLARTLAGPRGLTWFVTHSRAQVPESQAAVGVGRPLANVGFTGLRLVREAGLLTWRALLTNPGVESQTRSWWVEANGERTPARSITIAAGGLLEISGHLPDGIDSCIVSLSPDDFLLDDQLPILRPVAKPLPVRLDLDADTGSFIRQVLDTVEGVTLAASQPPRLRVLRLAPDSRPPPEAAIVLPPEPAGTSDRARILKAPVVVEKHPLTDNLNWQGWLGSGPAGFSFAPKDTPLLWQNEQPLVWLTAGPDDTRRLVLNFDWNMSNAPRLPAPALLLRRYVEQVRDAQPGSYAANFDTEMSVSLAARDCADAATLEFKPVAATAPAEARTVSPAELAIWHTPPRPGFFVLRRDQQLLIRGATQFADPRQSDFRHSETFLTETPPEVETLVRRNTRPDPYAQLWVVLLGLCLLGSWWPDKNPVPARAPRLGRTTA